MALSLLQTKKLLFNNVPLIFIYTGAFCTLVSNNDNIIVNADAERLTQVVSNLLTNAFKFTQKGEISVNITTDDTDQQAIVSVTGTGQGIDPEMMP